MLVVPYVDVKTTTIIVFFVEFTLERKANKHTEEGGHTSPVTVSTAVQAKPLSLHLS